MIELRWVMAPVPESATPHKVLQYRESYNDHDTGRLEWGSWTTVSVVMFKSIEDIDT